jgi:hypothetical protein
MASPRTRRVLADLKPKDENSVSICILSWLIFIINKYETDCFLHERQQWISLTIGVVFNNFFHHQNHDSLIQDAGNWAEAAHKLDKNAHESGYFYLFLWSFSNFISKKLEKSLISSAIFLKTSLICWNYLSCL